MEQKLLDLSCELVKRLTNKKLTIGFSESVTGGMLSDLIVAIPGASKIYAGSLVTYQSEVKTRVLKVKKHILKRDTAVSESVAKAMLLSAKNLLKTDILVITTGFADGVNAGTGFIGFKLFKKIFIERFNFKGFNRNATREKICEYIFTKIIEVLSEEN